MKTQNWLANGTAGHEQHGQSAVYCADTGKNIAIVYDGKAHADLIASAPELLAMLERVFKVMPARLEESGELLEGQIAALIAKAKGEA